MKTVKERLKHFINSKNVENDQILLVAHSNFLKHFTSTHLNEKTNKPEGHHTFLNSEYMNYKFSLNKA